MYVRGFGVRPVVSLRSNVTVEQLQEITGSTDSDWPGHGNFWRGTKLICGYITNGYVRDNIETNRSPLA